MLLLFPVLLRGESEKNNEEKKNNFHVDCQMSVLVKRLFQLYHVSHAHTMGTTIAMDEFIEIAPSSRVVVVWPMFREAPISHFQRFPTLCCAHSKLDISYRDTYTDEGEKKLLARMADKLRLRE